MPIYSRRTRKKCSHDLRQGVFRTGKKTTESLYFASRMACALVDSASWEYNFPVRDLVKSMESTMETAVKVRASFFSRYKEYKGSGVDTYTSTHLHGDHLLGSNSANWFSEAQRTGKIFLDGHMQDLVWTSGYQVNERMRSLLERIITSQTHMNQESSRRSAFVFILKLSGYR